MDPRETDAVAFCMPCMQVSSDCLGLCRVTAVLRSHGVWGRVARSSKIRGRWNLVWCGFAGVNGDSTMAIRIMDGR
jgi:hypothetical protein